MLYPKLETFIFFILLSILMACGDDGYNGNRGNSERDDSRQTEEAPPPENFNTRLNSSLLIAGDKCLGGETSENNGQVITCNSGQYLVTVDNINTCDSSGQCTEVGVFPIIGELQLSNDSDPNFTFFNILPRSPVSSAQSNILIGVSVRVGTDGTTQVVLK